MSKSLRANSRDSLLARKRDLFDALRVLERDHAEGSIDADAYRRARERYEREAAMVLERLDQVQTVDVAPAPSRRPLPWVAAGAGVVVVAALALFLVQALHPRGAGSITGLQPGGVPTPARAVPSPVATALALVQVRPHNLSALLRLGQAYLDSGDPADADHTLRTAMRLDPRRPQAPTLDALILAYRGRLDAALALLARVEHIAPRYARAWLTDGLISSRRRSTLERALFAWRHFLRLQPSGSLAKSVRASIAELEHASGGTR